MHERPRSSGGSRTVCAGLEGGCRPFDDPGEQIRVDGTPQLAPVREDRRPTRLATQRVCEIGRPPDCHRPRNGGLDRLELVWVDLKVLPTRDRENRNMAAAEIDRGVVGEELPLPVRIGPS